MKSQIEQLHDHLFGEPKTCVYAILDGASIPDLLPTFESTDAKHVCLYRGELDPELAQSAPYLVLMQPETMLTNWILSGFGKHWGIFAVSRSNMMEMRQHFRRFILVHDVNGKPFYFRYYDPRVFQAYLTNCNSEKRQMLFGPVMRFFMEGEEAGSLLRFVATNERPVSKKILIQH